MEIQASNLCPCATAMASVRRAITLGREGHYAEWREAVATLDLLGRELYKQEVLLFGQAPALPINLSSNGSTQSSTPASF